VHEERRLRGVGGAEIVGGALEADPAQRHSKRIVSFLKGRPRFGKRRGEVFPHAWLLRALPRE
jgi:hypothetical protein